MVLRPRSVLHLRRAYTSNIVYRGAIISYLLRWVSPINRASTSGFLTRRAVTFGVNDVYDYDSDIRNPRKNNQWADGTVLSQGNQKFILLSARVSTIFVVLLALPASIRSPQVLGYTISFLALIWMYSSPPLRLKERPLWDSLSNGLICWLFWACGSTFYSERYIISSTLTSKNGWFIFLGRE